MRGKRARTVPRGAQRGPDPPGMGHQVNIGCEKVAKNRTLNKTRLKLDPKPGDFTIIRIARSIYVNVV